jgi:hypothetical protein
MSTFHWSVMSSLEASVPATNHVSQERKYIVPDPLRERMLPRAVNCLSLKFSAICDSFESLPS